MTHIERRCQFRFFNHLFWVVPGFMGKSRIKRWWSPSELETEIRSSTWAKRFYLWRLLSSCRAPLRINPIPPTDVLFVDPCKRSGPDQLHPYHLTLHVEYAGWGIKYGILFIVSLFYEYSDLEYVHFHVIYRVQLIRRNTLITFVWLRHRNTWISIPHVGP